MLTSSLAVCTVVLKTKHDTTNQEQIQNFDFTAGSLTMTYQQFDENETVIANNKITVTEALQKSQNFHLLQTNTAKIKRSFKIIDLQPDGAAINATIAVYSSRKILIKTFILPVRERDTGQITKFKE